MITAEEEKLIKEISAEPVKVFLQAALLSKAKGDSYNYNHIVHQLRVRDDHDMVATVYIGLTSCVSQFTQRPDLYRDLMQSIFSYDWNCERKVTLAYVNLLGHILSSNVTFLMPAFHMLVSNLVRFSDLPTQDIAVISANEERAVRIHSIIQQIVVMVPTGLSELFPVLAQHYPHKRFSQKIISDYVTHLLTICEYFSLLQSRILDLIVCKGLEIDVEIVIEDSGEVKISEEHHGEIGDDMFEDITANTTVTSNMQRMYSEGSQFIPVEVAEMADKLDAILCLVVEFLVKEIQKNEIKNEKSNTNNIDKLSNQLMVIFEDKILMTHRSKFVQFIIFFFASKVEKFCENFASRMVKIFFDETATQLKRQSAILYLASYTVRANFLSTQVVSTILIDLISWADSYVNKSGTAYVPVSVITPASDTTHSHRLSNGQNGNNGQNGTNGQINQNGNNDSSGTSVSDMNKLGSFDDTMGDDEDIIEVEVDEFGRAQSAIDSAVSRHETFFSCVQAACYILCFYGVNAATTQKNTKNIQKKWQKVITCTLQPMRFCLQSVRVEFLRLAQQVNLLDESCWESLPSDVIAQSQNNNTDNNNNNNNNNNIISNPLNRLNRNKNVQTNKNKNVNMGAGFNPLDSFFPYDPCLLCMLHQPIEKSYRAWRGVPGLDDVIDVEVEFDVEVEVDTYCIKGSNAGTSSENMSFNMHNDKLEGRSRTGSVGSVSSDGSDYSQSMSSSSTPFGMNSGTYSINSSQNQSLNVSMSISMTETLGMGLLEEQEKEKILRLERQERIERKGATYLDSRAQSMVSDCSFLEDDQNQSPGSNKPYNSFNSIISYAQFDALVGKGGIVGGLGGGGGGRVYHNQSTGNMGIGGLVGSIHNNGRRDAGGGRDGENDGRGDDRTDGVTQLSDLAWVKPARRPRQYSVGSTGSW